MSIFNNLKNTNTVETDVAIGDDNFKVIETKKIFFLDKKDNSKFVTVECLNDNLIMTDKEFENVFRTIYNSSMYYACNARYVSANRAKELCEEAGFNCDAAYSNLRTSYGNLWRYTGD